MEENKEIPKEIIETLSQIDVEGYKKYGMSQFSFLKEFNVMTAIGSHDLYKHFDWKYREIMKELGKDHELTKLFNKLMTAISDAGWAISAGHFGKDEENKILKKYSHNIMSVLSDNQLVLSTKSELIVKEVGNKAFKLWEMSKAGLPVPPAFFLTFAATRASQVAGNVIPPILEKLMLFFKGESVAIRSSGIESMPGMLETIYIKDSSNYTEVCAAIMQVINSWNNEKAVKYRQLCKIDDLLQIGVVIQKLVNAENKTGFSGSAYSHNPNTGEKVLNGEVLLEKLGEQLASGEKTPENLTVIPKELYNELNQHVELLYQKYKKAQYVEFAYDGEKLYMLQCRDAKLSEYAVAKIMLEYFQNDWVDSTRLERYYNDAKYNKNLKKTVIKNSVPITTGIAASSGTLVGKILINVQSKQYDKTKYIWFTDITTTTDLPKIKKVDGIVTTLGGYTSHPADVSRLLNKAAIVSAKGLKIFKDHITINDERLEEGELVTIVGESGEIYKGEVEIERKFVLEEEYKNALNNI